MGGRYFYIYCIYTYLTYHLTSKGSKRSRYEDVITDLSSHKNGQFYTPGFPSYLLLCPSKEI